MKVRMAAAVGFSFVMLAFAAASQAPESKPLTLALACAGGDCDLLHGAPETSGMRSGFVRLKPGESVGWHTTGQHEEALVILHGRGEAQIDGRTGMPLASPMLAYIPPDTRHNVKNTGDTILEYVYVVAPTASK